MIFDSEFEKEIAKLYEIVNYEDLNFVLGELMASQVNFQNLISIKENFEILGIDFDYSELNDETDIKPIFVIIKEILDQRHIAVHHAANQQKLSFQPHIALEYVQKFLVRLSLKTVELADKHLHAWDNGSHKALIPYWLTEDYTKYFKTKENELEYNPHEL